MRSLRRIAPLAMALVLTLASALSVAAAPADPFTGTYVSTDLDGSNQRLGLGGPETTRNVTLFDDLATAACDPAQPLVLRGTGTIAGGELDVLLSWRCRDGSTHDALVTFTANDDGTLTDSTGVEWSRPGG